MLARERILLTIGFCAFCSGALAQQQTSDLPTFVVDQVIVGFAPGAPGLARAAAHAQAGGSPIRSLDAIDASVVRVTPGRVEQPNYLRALIIPDEGQDPPPPAGLGIDYFDEQYGLHNTGQSFAYDPNTGAPGALTGVADADIDAPEAWDLDTGAAWVKVAVLDTGVDCLHADLAGKCIESINFGPSAHLDDEIGHGTHVAGTIAATGNNSIGVAGVSWGATIGAFKVCYEYYDWLYGLLGLCDSVAMIDALVYATDNGYHVANMSFGGPETGPGEAAAMTYAYNGGVVLVAAAGNNYTPNLTYPAAYPEVIAVAATDWFDNIAGFSSFGSGSPEIQHHAERALRSSGERPRRLLHVAIRHLDGEPHGGRRGGARLELPIGRHGAKRARGSREQCRYGRRHGPEHAGLDAARSPESLRRAQRWPTAAAAEQRFANDRLVAVDDRDGRRAVRL
jgi:hypothetical protein